MVLRDIPMFTTELGVASLVLSQIPYTKKAYIRIQDASDSNEFLQECISFCVAAGAEHIFAAGHPACEEYPEHTVILEMRADISSIGDTDAALFPVTEGTLNQWVEIYNQKIIKIPNGAWMNRNDANKMLHEGNGYFIHRDGDLLGIGKASGSEISWVAAVKPGAGADIVRALCHALSEDTVTLTVSSQNQKALSLYNKLGFLCSGIISTWYVV